MSALPRRWPVVAPRPRRKPGPVAQEWLLKVPDFPNDRDIKAVHRFDLEDAIQFGGKILFIRALVRLDMAAPWRHAEGEKWGQIVDLTVSVASTSNGSFRRSVEPVRKAGWPATFRGA